MGHVMYSVKEMTRRFEQNSVLNSHNTCNLHKFEQKSTNTSFFWTEFWCRWSIPYLNFSINVDGHTLSDYAVKMSNPSEWGSALEIAAAAEMFSVGIYIYQLRRGREIQS